MYCLQAAAALITLYCTAGVSGWHDRAHISIMEASKIPYSSCLAIAPDILVTKWPTEAGNHYTFIPGTKITTSDVLAQVGLYDKEDTQGHLYGAVVASTNIVRSKLINGTRPDYSYSFLAHYVGDLSQPLHNSPYDEFNIANHNRIDGIVDKLPNLTKRVAACITPLHIQNDYELLGAVARLADNAKAADIALRVEGVMSQSDAIKLLGKSAALLRAISKYVENENIDITS